MHRVGQLARGHVEGPEDSSRSDSRGLVAEDIKTGGGAFTLESHRATKTLSHYSFLEVGAHPVQQRHIYAYVINACF